MDIFWNYTIQGVIILIISISSPFVLVQFLNYLHDYSLYWIQVNYWKRNGVFVAKKKIVLHSLQLLLIIVNNHNSVMYTRAWINIFIVKSPVYLHIKLNRREFLSFPDPGMVSYTKEFNIHWFKLYCHNCSFTVRSSSHIYYLINSFTN